MERDQVYLADILEAARLAVPESALYAVENRLSSSNHSGGS